MKSKTKVLLAVFNILFVIVEIVLFSRGLLNLGAHLIPALLAALLSVAAFVGINYWILTGSGKRRHVSTDKLKDLDDYRDALEAWQEKQNPFNPELRQAVHQLDLFCQKQTALKALLGDNAKEEGNPFLSVSEDVRHCLLSNMRKLLNRMTILDPTDQSKYPLHNEFVHHVLGQNKQLLSQYDNLIIEISQIGDSKDLENLHLDNITEALRELRDEHAAPAEESGMMMQQGSQEL